MPNTPEQPSSPEPPDYLLSVHLDQPFRPFHPENKRYGFFDWHGNSGEATRVNLFTPGEETPIPIHIEALGPLRQEQEGPLWYTAYAPLSKAGYQIDKRDYKPLERVAKFEALANKSATLPYSQAAMRLSAGVLNENGEAIDFSDAS